ncbi:MAG TPA: TspO/MBR family protein [Candidatus Paceibacterota bacterium]|nr:TspO/MBR family protein [Candidatus Paceibacterota bacterium]
MASFIKNLIPLALWILIAQGAGLIGSAFTAPAISGWYAALEKPQVAPPNWVFAPVWTTLFLLMGVAAYLVWRKPASRGRTLALKLFFAQLILNVLWSVLFFGLKSPAMALAEIALLWLSIAATIWAFSKISGPAALLLAPYLAWVSFASYLNFMLWTLNS